MFVDRGRELEWLHERFEDSDRQLLVLYGRRRVGKTALITRFLAETDAETIYFLCDQRGTEHNARRFAEQCAEHFEDVTPAVTGFDDAFSYITGRVDGDFVVAIDEFSYLVSEDDTTPSVFQRIYDDVLADTDISLLLCGSSISMMEEGALSYESPLYGRRTGQWRVEPFRFDAARAFVPEYDVIDQLRTYSVLGGTPAYLEQFDPDVDLRTNIERRVLSKGAFLYEEPEFLLRQELRDPSTYMGILEANANGATRVTEIANEIGRNASSLSRYLQNLTRLGLLEREHPVTDPDGRGVYRLTDQFLRFWFRYVLPNQGTLEQGATMQVVDAIEETFPTHASWTFEDVCRQVVSTPAFPVDCSRVGRWWYGEHEVDVVGVNEDAETLLLGECKWTSSLVGTNLLRDLETTEPEVRWRGAERDVTYALFAKHGFTDDLRDRAAERSDLHLFTLADVANLFPSPTIR